MRSPCWDDVDYEITQPFLPGPPAIHCGIDIGCPSGTIIHAARAGTVERVQVGMVGIHIDGSTQRDFYLHGYSLVVVGQHVDQGTPVIHSDTVQVDPRYPLTGPHLHFEVQDGYDLPGAPPFGAEHPLDPVPVLQGGLFMGLSDLDQQVLIWRVSVLCGTNKVSDAPPEVQPHLVGIVTIPALQAEIAALKPAPTKFNLTGTITGSGTTT